MHTQESVIDIFHEPHRGDAPTLNDTLSAKDTLVISHAAIPQAKAEVSEMQANVIRTRHPNRSAKPLEQRIAEARKQIGIKVIEIRDVAEIPQLTAMLSGEEVRNGEWRIRTTCGATKHLLRTTALHFENKVPPTDELKDVMHNVMPRAVKGGMEELEDRVSRLGTQETLKVRLPEPTSTSASWKNLMALRRLTGGRVRFLPHAKFRAEEYAHLPIEVEPELREKPMDATGEFPSLQPQDPDKVLRQMEDKPSRFGWRSLKNFGSGMMRGLKNLVTRS